MYLVLFNTYHHYNIGYSIEEVKAKKCYDRDDYTGHTEEYAYAEGYGEVNPSSLFEDLEEAKRYAESIVKLGRRLMKEQAFCMLSMLVDDDV